MTDMVKAHLIEKHKDILDAEGVPAIMGMDKRSIVATVLENTEREIRSGRMNLTETPANNTGNVSNYDPILMSMVRRAMPNLVHYDLMGVQAMTGPTGIVFAMTPKYTTGGVDAFYNEADTDYSGTGTHAGLLGTGAPTTGTGMATADAEALGSTGGAFGEMEIDISKITVTAKSRALKGSYTDELAQDMRAIHGLDAEMEISNILIGELLADINREAVRTVYLSAKAGSADTATAGTFDLDVDANGRWSVEKFKGLMFQIEKEASVIARETRRGRGNVILCSADVASALQMAGVLSHTPALNANNLQPDDTGNTFIGVLNNRYKVYIDPYAGANYMVIGYKGVSAQDAGLFYCPYVPIQMARVRDSNSFQPAIGYKTRYGMVANPLSNGATVGTGAVNTGANTYYRKTLITNLL